MYFWLSRCAIDERASGHLHRCFESKRIAVFFKKQNTFYTLKAGGVKNNHNYIEVMFKLYWDTYTFHIYMYT